MATILTPSFKAHVVSGGEKGCRGEGCVEGVPQLIEHVESNEN